MTNTGSFTRSSDKDQRDKRDQRGSKSFMSAKEKDYIAYKMEAVMKTEKKEIDYGDILEGKKITYDLSKQKKDFKLVFGKQTKRSRKWQRKSMNTATEWMSHETMISELLDLVAILKCIDLDEEGFREMEENGCEYFESSFPEIANCKELPLFLSGYFSVVSDSAKNKVFNFLIKNFDQIKNYSEFTSFLKSIDFKMNLENLGNKSDVNNLWSTENGYFFGKYLLEIDPENYRVLYDSFIKAPNYDSFIKAPNNFVKGNDSVKSDTIKRDSVKGGDTIKRDSVKGGDTIKRDSVKGGGDLNKNNGRTVFASSLSKFASKIEKQEIAKKMNGP